MAKKGFPIILQLFVITAFTSCLIVAGYYMTRKTMLYAEITLTDNGIRILNKADKLIVDWPPGTVFINNENSGVSAPLPAIPSGKDVFIPFTAFYETMIANKIVIQEVKKIVISDMKNFPSRGFEVKPVTIQTPKTNKR